MVDHAIRLDQVSVVLPGAERPTLHAVDVEIEEGELALVVGRTGSGKSTLLGAMSGRVPHFTGGLLRGRVLVHGRDTREHRPRDLADLVGVVGQDPLAGFVTDTVEEELAYGMEQLGLPAATMRKRVEETLDLLGIADLRGAALHELSGGQQQRVAIGSVLTAHPRVILLDEPTSALDPTGAEDVLATIARLVHDLAVTVVVAEHRVERVLHHADLVVHVTPDGSVRSGTPRDAMVDSDVASPVVELGRLAGWSPLPLTVREARRASAHADGLRARLTATRPRLDRPSDEAGSTAPTLARARGVVVRHPGDVLAVAAVDLDLRAGEVCALMGRNGSGKSSLLWALQGSGRLTAGTVEVAGPSTHDAPARPGDLTPRERRARVGLVPQDAADLLYLDTVAGECAQADAESDATPGTCAGLLAEVAPGIPAGRHPRDLSEGQRLALVLAVQLTADPQVLLLDEPTRGLDPGAKAALAVVLRGIAARGRAVAVSSHDVEFVAEVADRVVVLAGGEVVADGPTAEV
ncbi:MAG: ABC transporter ATP-binding protein, partial [Phycicoccus sp.]